MKALFIGSNEQTYQSLVEMVSRQTAGLRRVQLSLEWADSLSAGWSALSRERFDVCLLDGAPGIVRDFTGRGKSAPVILLTGDDSQDAARSAIENGAADVLLYSQLSLPLLERSILVALAGPILDRPGERAETICLEVEKSSAQPASGETCLDLSGWLDAVLQAVPVGVWISDGQGKIVRKNPAAERILGEELPLHDSLLGDTKIPAWWPDTGENLPHEDWPMVKTLRSGARVFHERIHYRRADGTVGTVLASTLPVEANGRTYGVLGLAEDISEQYRLEQEARQRAVETDAVFASLADAVIVYDREGVIRRANPAAVRMYGFDPVRMNRAALQERLKLRTLEGKLVSIDLLPSTRAVNGEWVMNEPVAWTNEQGQTYIVLASASPLLIDGEQTGVVVVWHDVTAREKLSKELASQRALMDFVLDQMPVGVSIAEAPSGRGLYHNEHAIRLLGHSLVEGEDYTRYNSYHAVHADGTPYQPEEYPSVRSILHGEVIRDERMLYRRGDEQALFSVSSVPVVDFGGRRIAAVCTFYDVTERERLLEENRRQRELLQAVFDADPAGLAVISGPDLTIRMANAAYRAVTSHPEIDPAGRSHDEVWPPEERFRPRPLLENVIEKGEPFSILKHERQLPDGTVRIFNYRVQPAAWEDEPAALVVLWDVTESAAAQEQMRRAAQEAQERANDLEALMDAVPAEVWIALDPDCRRVIGNRASYEVLRIPEGQNPSFTPSEGNSPSHFKVFSQGKQLAPEENPLQVSAREGIELHDFEKDIVFEDGEVRHLYGNATPLFDAEGKTRGAIAASIDVTELIRAREEAEKYAAQLERSNYDLEQFAYVASHDLQEPLRKVRFFGERLKEKFSSVLEDDDVDYLNRMLSASQRMQTMINALLTYSRITTKAQPFVPVDLNQVASEVVGDLEVRLVRSGGRVEIGDLPTIDADPMQMRQLFQNLIGNALKFHRVEERPPLVRIYEMPSADRRKTKGKQVTICVEDNGIGIDERHLTRIFQPFERLHGRSEYEGSGMGLAICQKIAERHRGAITVTSELDKGSRFMVTLPVKQANL